MLSLDAPGAPTPTPEWLGGLHGHAFFHDVESEIEAWELLATPPTLGEVGKGLVFGQRCIAESRKENIHLLVHCQQGVSRSPAMAFAILAMALGGGQEIVALKRIIYMRPYALPNKLVVQLADQWLKRGGALKRALDLLWVRPSEFRPIWLAQVAGSGRLGTNVDGVAHSERIGETGT